MSSSIRVAAMAALLLAASRLCALLSGLDVLVQAVMALASALAAEFTAERLSAWNSRRVKHARVSAELARRRKAAQQRHKEA